MLQRDGNFKSLSDAIQRDAESQKDQAIGAFLSAYRSQSDDVGAGLGGISLSREQIGVSSQTLDELVKSGHLVRDDEKYCPSEALSQAYRKSLSERDY